MTQDPSIYDVPTPDEVNADILSRMIFDCPLCGGNGQRTVLTCCGRGQGECCGSPEPGEVQCEVCGGAGQFPNEMRRVTCPDCGGDGGGDTDQGSPYSSNWIKCRSCAGCGEIAVSVEPITLEDLETLPVTAE